MEALVHKRDDRDTKAKRRAVSILRRLDIVSIEKIR